MTPSSRDTDSRSSPRSRRSTVSRLRRADNRPPRPRPAAPPGFLRRRRHLIGLPHLDTPPASTLSQSSVQENPGAQECEAPQRLNRTCVPTNASVYQFTDGTQPKSVESTTPPRALLKKTKGLGSPPDICPLSMSICSTSSMVTNPLGQEQDNEEGQGHTDREAHAQQTPAAQVPGHRGLTRAMNSA